MPTCFHHTDRETGRLCTRCGRPACPDCLRQASVGSHCFECDSDAQPPQGERLRRKWRAADLLAAKTLIGANVVAFLAMGSGSANLDWALYGPYVAHGDWYRLVTSGFVHYGLLHIGMNMYILYIVALALERSTGTLRFSLIYAVSLLAGSFGALLLDPLAITGGASGAVFGVAAATTVALHSRGVRFMNTGFGPLLLINVVLSFAIPQVSIGGHLGGLAGGTLAGYAMLHPRATPRTAAAGIASVAVISVVGALWAASQSVPG